MSEVWFSAMLRFVILVEDEGAVRLSRGVVLFKADDWPAAKARALDLGKGMERTYAGATGLEVRWRLQAVETLDLLGDSITDGREVYAEPLPLPPDASVVFDVTVDPAAEPGRSGV